MARPRHIRCFCDNEAVMHVVASRYSKSTDLMHLLHCLFFFEAYYQLHITAMHVPGSKKALADDLSRTVTVSLLSPYRHLTCQHVLHLALDLLLNPAMDWSSAAWIELIRTIVL